MSRENIVLIGFMGSGKSSAGRLIASKLGWQFVDTDSLIIKKHGIGIPEIFNQKGETYFREEESLALASLQGGDRCVIATGGGIVTRPENVSLMRDLGFVVWLKAGEEVIFERVSRNTNRPLLQTGNPRETISLLLAQRNPLYLSAAQYSIDTSDSSRGEIIDSIIEKAQEYFEAMRRNGS